jgi:hypothetical protein
VQVVGYLLLNFPCVLWNTALCYSRSPLALFLSQMNPLHVVPIGLLPIVELQVTVSARVSREESVCLYVAAAT